jgi:membrane-associated protein
MGPRLFKKQNGMIFRQEYVHRAEAFYEKHGGKTMIFARFVPVVRTFAPMVAGVGKMPRRRFMVFVLIGAAFWTGLVVMLGYWLGSLIDPHLMERFLLLAIALAMLVSFGPTIYHLVKDKRLRNFVVKRWKSAFRSSVPKDKPTDE